jgi:2'-5' RNA ligase
MRLFVALDIDAAIRQRLQEFVNDLHARVPGVRFVGPETFHVTLKFLGETRQVEEIERALASVRGVPFEISFRGNGFFPAANRARVFWAGIEAPGELQALAARVDEVARTLGFPPERGPYKPHLTLARPGSGNPRGKPGDRPAGVPDKPAGGLLGWGEPRFQAIQQYLSGKPAPEFGTMTAHEFFLFESILSPRGATYRKVRRYPLT